MASEGGDAVKTDFGPASLNPDSKPRNGQAILDPNGVRLKSKISLCDGVAIIIGIITGAGVSIMPQIVMVAMTFVIDFLVLVRYCVYSCKMDLPRKVQVAKITLLGIIIMPMVVTAQLRQCEQPDDPVRFLYKCLGQGGEMVNLCLPGRHLAIAQPACVGEVDRNRICEECSYGYYMSEYNYCDDCHPWKECEPGEMEDPDNPPSAVRDRVCIPVPPTTAVSTAVLSPQCPPCECTGTCPECPTCPEVPTCSSLLQTDTKSTLHTDGLADATPSVPNSTTPSTKPDANGVLGFQSELQMWKNVTIGLAVAVFLLLIVVGVLVIIIIRQRCKSQAAEPERGPDLNGGPCNNLQRRTDLERGPDVVHYSGANGLNILTAPSQEPSSRSDNIHPPSSENPHASHSSNEHPLTEEPPKPTAASNEHKVNVHESPTSSTSSNTSCHVAAPETGTSEPPKSLLGNNKPFNRAYDVSGDTPSTQPLLGSNGQQEDTMASSMAPNAFQQSVPNTNIPSEVVNHPDLLSSATPNDIGIHEAPTAACMNSLPVSPSFSAFEKAEGPCGTTTICTEEHADFVKDNIAVNLHKDFFAKLGVSKKHYDATIYDSRNEKIREQIRHVLIEDFIGKQSDPSVYRLLRALDESGNMDVTRDFKVKFQVSCSAGC